ncbi:MAG: Holliday junction resolvase RuvX [Calditrichaeota bacterium]|nr:MAG: Holliday junction resolvase RuvX [Calditrichota bacterium]
MTHIILALDIGHVRIGVAVSDALGMLAHPVTTLKARPDGSVPLEQLQKLIDEKGATRLVVGLPLTLKGEKSRQTVNVEKQIEYLKKHLNIPVETMDERLSTRLAGEQLRAAGKKASQNRHIIDQMAAVNILQLYLDKQQMKRRIS